MQVHTVHALERNVATFLASPHIGALRYGTAEQTLSYSATEVIG